MQGLKENVDIKSLIYEVRGKQVMLDSDVAYLFGYEVKQLNRQITRNKDRFPENYCFKITKEEYDSLRCQNGTLKSSRGEHRKYMPYVFKEYGITMLAGLLKSKIAVEASIRIVNQFIEMKKLLKKNNDSLSLINDIYNIKNKLLIHDKNFEIIFDKFERKEDFKSKLFFDGEIYDAYSLLVDVIGKTNKEIIIIDNYVDKVTLDILSKKKVSVTVLLIMDENKSKLNNTDINKFNSEYPLLRIRCTNAFHDRFIILDNKYLYHLGASLKDLGKKVFGVTKIEDKLVLNDLINKILDAN